MTTAIHAEHLGKCYRLSHEGKGPAYYTLRDRFSQLVSAPLRRLRGEIAKSDEEFWAVNDVSFSIKQGEAVGIIGRNGAGKSTLLKLLSRITKPTRGRCTIRGRMGSLLEVGTGFHPELTGRENIFMNGSVLGMGRREIQRKFDEIVAFAEVEKFLDTPVKRYSSGMYVRLAFAVAAHLEPEILIVDEVLSVGDANFQRKCLGKMEDVASHGRTVLFVTHSMPMVQRLCNRAILLDQGNVLFDGGVSEAVQGYLNNGATNPGIRVWDDPATAPGNEHARLHAIKILDKNLQVTNSVEIDEDFYIEIIYHRLSNEMPTHGAFNIFNEEGILLFGAADFLDPNFARVCHQTGLISSRCKIPAHLMAEGSFSVLAAVVSYNPDQLHARELDAVQFQIVDRTEGTGVRGHYAGGRWPGVMRPWVNWCVSTL